MIQVTNFDFYVNFYKKLSKNVLLNWEKNTLGLVLKFKNFSLNSKFLCGQALFSVFIRSVIKFMFIY